MLGEDVLDRDAARRSTEHIVRLVRLIPEGLERNVSIKLTMLGFQISEDFCLEQAASILSEAKKAGGFVRIDMEGSAHTQRTLEVFRKLRKDFDNVGIVLQAALHRTYADVEECVKRKDRVRLCKGAYKEPPEVALQDMGKIREAFASYAHALMDGGSYPAIATHDEALIADACTYANATGIPPSRFEFQMLYGLRKRRWESLVRDGYGMRVYVPYGTHWIPYFYRRLRERKENVLFVLQNLFR
jgi:proline dehydrogenase